MLPPPTTTATSTPRSATCLICAAMAAMRSLSAPYSSGPIRASPESFRRIRRNAGVRAPFPSTGLLLAHREPAEAADHHVLARLRGGLAPDLLDRAAVVLVRVHVRLAQEHDLVEPLPQPALGDLRTHVLGL